MTRTAPSWFTKWLRQHYPDRRVVWNLDRKVWEIQHNERAGVMDNWVVELTYPRDNIYGDLCDKILKGDWVRRGVRFKDFWRETVTAPDAIERARRVKRANEVQREIAREGKKHAWRDLGKRVTVGAVKNERIGNKLKIGE